MFLRLLMLISLQGRSIIFWLMKYLVLLKGTEIFLLFLKG